MPHLTIHYSDRLSSSVDVPALCARLRSAIAELGAYPIGGIRVRAVAVACQSVADGHAENAFFDMVFRIAPGRSTEVKRATGDALMAVVEAAFAAELAQPHLALSLEIVEISRDFSWKTNSIHPRLQAKH